MQYPTKMQGAFVPPNGIVICSLRAKLGHWDRLRSREIHRKRLIFIELLPYLSKGPGIALGNCLNTDNAGLKRPALKE
jgi:hypothetical protein